MLWDMHFHNRFLVRRLTWLKFAWINNSYGLPTINKIVWFFQVRKLELLEDPRTFNYFYLFTFFFGRRAAIVSFKSFFELGKTYYNYNVQLTVCNKDMYQLLTVFNYEFQPFVNLKMVRKYYFSSARLFSLIFNDNSIFIEKKTNIGLFDIKDPLNLRIFFSGATTDLVYSKFLVSAIKLITI